MTIHSLIGSELITFIDRLKEGQFIANLIHNPPGVYIAYVVDLQPQPELFKSNIGSKPHPSSRQNAV